MATKLLFLLVSLVASGLCTNKSRYKIVLRQQGYTQFIQYDVATPPLREITLCIWIKLYHNQGPQSILTYLAKGNNRIIKMWLDEGARYLMLTIKGYVMPKILINLGLNNWNHLCFSYQSEYGAYAVYLNGDLLQCEATEKLIGYALPPGGSIIIGYGITLDGKPTGLTGEIYGVNMIIASTITINNTIGINNLMDQSPINKNLTANHNTNMKYVILNELKDNETDIYYLQSKTQKANENKFQNHKYLQELFDSQEAKDLQSSKTFSKQNKELLDKKENFKYNSKHIKPKHTKGSFRIFSSEENSFGSTYVSETSFPEASLGLVQYEVPPPLPSMPPRTTKKPSGFRKHDNSLKQLLSNNLEYTPDHILPPARSPNIQMSSFDEHKIINFPVTNTEIKTESLVQHVVPPPLPPDPFTTHDHAQKTKTSKSNEKKSMKKKSTKQNPSDLHPREILEFEVPPPPTTDTKVYGQWTAFTHNGKISDFLKQMKYDYRRVPPTIPLITVSETFPYPPYKMATNLVPNHINRRVFYKREANRPEINVKILNDHDIKTSILNEHSKIQVRNVNITHRGEPDLKTQDNRTNKDIKYDSIDNYDDETFIKERPLFVELPFIKALEYYEPNLQSRNNSINKDAQTAQTRKEDLKYNRGQELTTDYNTINKENHWNPPKESIKYVLKQKITDAEANQMDLNSNKDKHEKNFHRPVKIGNALNERFVIGKNAEQKKRSFEGGDELVPEINRYRSDIDKVYDKIPNSLMPRVCRNIDMLELSTKNVERHKYSMASEFILQSLMYDFQDNSKYEYDSIFYINWHQTPVRLFGGASPLKEPDICAIIKCETNTEPTQ